jgi:hypothetical protein
MHSLKSIGSSIRPKRAKPLYALMSALFFAGREGNATNAQNVTTAESVVLVHGLYADGSSRPVVCSTITSEAVDDSIV